MYIWGYFLPILGVITLCASEPVKILNVFSYTAKAQLIYKKIHETQSHDGRQPTTDPQEKEEICQSLTAHNRLFNHYKYEKIEMSKIYEELKTEYEDIFNELYAVPSDSSHGSDKIYVNRTKEIFAYNSWDGGRFLEYLFVCLVRRVSDNRLEKIYVSGEYDARDPSNTAGPLKVGRFIFHDVEYFPDPVVYGFVEEPAVVLSTSVDYLEIEYLRRKKPFRPGRQCPRYMRESIDLDIYRFCNVVMNAAANDGERRFVGRVSNNSEDKCVLMEVSFRTSNAQEKAMGKYYTAWTIRCLMEKDDGTSAWYHITRANKSVTKVFVFRETDDQKVELQYLSTDVRFSVPRDYS